MVKRRLTEAEIERACEMRERGMSINAIRRVIGNISPGALAWHFLARAVSPPKPRPLRIDHHVRRPLVKRGDHVVRAFTPEEDARLIAMERQGLCNSVIARALGRKPNSVRGRLMTLARRDERAETLGTA